MVTNIVPIQYGNTVVSEFQYGDDLPAAGMVGRIFFKRVQT